MKDKRPWQSEWTPRPMEDNDEPYNREDDVFPENIQEQEIPYEDYGFSGEDCWDEDPELTEEEDEAVIEKINETCPDIVWVGLGAPKQEIWMAEHQGRINAVMIGVGAGFDYYAGNIKRAPVWMQRCNLEWLYRLMQDPKRLLKRYWNTNWKFIWNAYIRGR